MLSSIDLGQANYKRTKTKEIEGKDDKISDVDIDYSEKSYASDSGYENFDDIESVNSILKHKHSFTGDIDKLAEDKEDPEKNKEFKLKEN